MAHPSRTLASREKVMLRPARPGDWSKIEGWIARPDIARWWGTASAAEAEIRMAWATDGAIARIIEVGDVAAGYCHAIDATYWGASLPDGMPAGTWDVDVVVAEPAYRSCGVGEAALDLIAEEVFGTTLALALSVIVAVTNEGAVRAYERAGFRWVKVWDDPILGPSWLMLRERAGT
ncbi:MAG: GNAT family N-acetyltransferase [Hyphomicrobiaceae bacterium]|nr:GNAT family N-acetyltransferase [Hyphomicrobiaceae bacterium]